jgi:hypothetical protein
MGNFIPGDGNDNWKTQLRGNDGRWINMYGPVSFDYTPPGGGPAKKGRGTFQGVSSPGRANIFVKDDPELEVGMYEVQSQFVKGVKAFIPTAANEPEPKPTVEAPITPELKAEVTGDEAMQVVRNAGAEYAKSQGRFAMARTYNDIKQGLRNQYMQLFEGIKQDNPELLKNQFIINEDGTGRTGDIVTEDDLWGAIKALQVQTSSRWMSPDGINPLAKELNGRYAEKFLGLKKDGLITFYRNAISEKEDPAEAAAGYASLDKKMAWDYNSQKASANEVNKGRYIVKARPDEVLGILGLSGAVDEFGVVISPEVTSLPGRFERVGGLEKQTIDTAPWVDSERLDEVSRLGGNSPFRFLAPMTNFDYYALDSSPFGEGTGWSSFYEANGLELGAMPTKYNELYGEGAWEKDFGDSSPRAAVFVDLFKEFTNEQGEKKWGLDALKLRGLSDIDMLNSAESGDSFDRSMKVLSAMQELMGKPFFVNKGHDQSDPRIPKAAEISKTPNESKPTNSNIFSETYPTLEDEREIAALTLETMLANGISLADVAKADSVFPRLPEKIKKDILEKEEVLKDFAIDFVQTLAKDWNGSPISTDSMKALQSIASKEFGIADILPEDMTDKAKEIVEQQENVYREFIKAQYQRTQEFFKSKGITEVKLYRGYRATDLDVNSKETAKLRPLSSWSTDKSTGEAFGQGLDDSILLEETVPVSRIFSTQPVGLGVWNEKEVVVIGDSKPVAETPKPTPDAEESVDAPKGRDVSSQEMKQEFSTSEKSSDLKDKVAQKLLERILAKGVTKDELVEMLDSLDLAKSTALAGPYAPNPEVATWDSTTGIVRWEGSKRLTEVRISVIRTEKYGFNETKTVKSGNLDLALTNAIRIYKINKKQDGIDGFNEYMTYDEVIEFVRKVNKIIDERKGDVLHQTKSRIVFEDNIEEAKDIMSYSAVSNMVAEWAGSSNDDSVFSLALQDTVAKLFNLENYLPWTTREDTSENKDALIKLHGKVISAYAEAQYEITQEELKAKGITSVELHRGMQDPNLRAALDEYGSLPDNLVILRPLSSFSYDLQIAGRFAGDNQDVVGLTYEQLESNPEALLDFIEEAEYNVPETNLVLKPNEYLDIYGEVKQYGGVVLNTTVPADRIFSMPFSGVGCLSESEVVVLGPNLRAEVIRPEDLKNYLTLAELEAEEDGEY